MITKYTFSLKDNNKTNPSIYYNTDSTNYSKILDDLINANIKEKNASWLNYDTPATKTIKINISSPKFMSKTYSYFNGFKFGDSCPYIEDKIYYLADGTPFYFTKDYITIGFNTYYFYEFANPLFIKGLTKDFKKTIATIYINGLKITIKK